MKWPSFLLFPDIIIDDKTAFAHKMSEIFADSRDCFTKKC